MKYIYITLALLGTPSFSQLNGRSTAPASTYLIFPVDSAIPAGQNQTAFIDLLDKQLNPDDYDATNLTGIGILFISANLTDAQVKDLNASSLISDIVPDIDVENNDFDEPAGTPIDPQQIGARDLEDPVYEDSILKTRNFLERRAQVIQRNALPELKVFSQKPGTRLEDAPGYIYDDSAGAGATVYVVDSGFNALNPEYTRLRKKPRWIYGGKQKEKPFENDIDGENGHGSCVGSKVAGPRFGIAKSVNLVVVKIGFGARDLLDALSQICNDVMQRNLQGRAVVNISSGIARDLLSGPQGFGVIREMFRVIYFLTANDVVVVVAAGNNFTTKGNSTPEDIDTYPQLFASTLPIIVVGASDNNGKNASFSKGGPLVHVMAPGVDVRCAANSADHFTKTEGTSLSAPSVAGLAAYLLSLRNFKDLEQKGSVAETIRNLIQRLAYPRVDNGFPVAFNGAGERCNTGLVSNLFHKPDSEGKTAGSSDNFVVAC